MTQPTATRPHDGKVFVGVSSTVTMHDVVAMGGDGPQDQFLREVAQDLETKLRDMVAGAGPVSDLAFQVTGPHNDPIQGLIYAHTLAGWFRVDDLSSTCEAYRLHVQPEGDQA